MDSNASQLVDLGDRLFAKKAQLDELHQTLAEQVYPERANFTQERTQGDEYADELYESVPAQNRRELAGAIGAILRPRSKEWFRPMPTEDSQRTDAAMEWCDWARDRMRRLLYSDRTRFQKVSADADDDFCTFGNAIPILTENPDRNGILFELTHLKCNAWSTNRYNEVDVNHRKFKMTLRAIVQRWGEDALTEQQKKILEKAPYTEIELRHICMPSKDFDPYMPRKKWGAKPYASIYLNPEGRKTIEEKGYFEFPYLHRRWKVPDDSVYGYSPAAMLGLVDARVLQAQSRVILDAGELAVAPPLLAKRDAVLGGVNNYAGAITWLDTEYDERFGDAIRAIDNGGDVRLGLEMKIDTRNVLAAAWYLNRLTLPSDSNMTAYEVSERIAEYIRSAGPIFEPFEADNARTLDTVFKMCKRLGYFGSIEEMPQELRVAEIQFEFDTPVSQAYQRVKVVRARETIETIGPMLNLDPELRDHFDLDRMARETAINIGADSGWLRTNEEVEQIRSSRAEQLKEVEQLEKADAALSVADKAATAGQKAAGIAQIAPQLAAQMQQMLGQQQPQVPDGGLYPEGSEFDLDAPGLDELEGQFGALEGLDGLDFEGGIEDIDAEAAAQSAAALAGSAV